MSGFLMLINNMLETNVGLLTAGMSGRDELMPRLIPVKANPDKD